MASLKTPLPWESYFYKPSSWFEPLCWENIFCSSSEGMPIHVDLGAGDGGFIRARAKAHPQTYFLGVERLLGRARKIARGAYRDHLPNLRALRIEAAYAVERLFPKESISSITILFPDPWPKRRHQKNRLIQTALLDACAQCLRPDGWIAIKTDDASYFEHIQEALRGCAELREWPHPSPDPLLPEPTDFERDFIREGRPIYFVAAKRHKSDKRVNRAPSRTVTPG